MKNKNYFIRNIAMIIFLQLMFINQSNAQHWELLGNTPFSTDFLGSTNGNPLNLVTQMNTDIKFFTNAGITFSNQAMTISGTPATLGFVGIGTTGPSYLLDVAGDININNPYKGYRLSNSVDSKYVLWNNDDYTSIFVGMYAGNSSMIGNFENTFVGCGAGNSLSSGQQGNTFIGYLAGNTTSTGAANTFIGDGSGVTSNGDDNVFIGSGVGGQGGTDNIAIGNASGGFAASDLNNTVIGYTAGTGHMGTDNCYFGYDSGDGINIPGTGNSFFGAKTGSFISGGSNNTFIGFYAGDDASSTFTDFNNRIALGANTFATADNTCIIGDNDIYVGIGLSNDPSGGPQNKLEINAGLYGFAPAPAGNPAYSGLRFRDMNSNCSTSPVFTTNVLSVNNFGDVILIPQGAAPAITGFGACPGGSSLRPQPDR